MICVILYKMLEWWSHSTFKSAVMQLLAKKVYVLQNLYSTLWCKKYQSTLQFYPHASLASSALSVLTTCRETLACIMFTNIERMGIDCEPKKMKIHWDVLCRKMWIFWVKFLALQYALKRKYVRSRKLRV